MSVNFRLRHFWTKVIYTDFYELDLDGNLVSTNYNDFNDQSFNSWNIDMVYRWRFAPGSDIFIVWKNSISDFSNDPSSIIRSYPSAFQRLRDLPENNLLSVKLVYFLDYAALTAG